MDSTQLRPSSGERRMTMPWYDYQCEKCGFVFEVQRTMSDTSKVRCKSCNSTRTVKIFAPAGIQFKGNGFYATDSRNGSASSVASPADSSADTSTDTDTKSATAKKPDAGKQSAGDKFSKPKSAKNIDPK